MIYNTRNQSKDTTESQNEKKTSFNAHAGVKLDCPMYSNQRNEMWLLKSLVILKCESGTSLYTVYTIQMTVGLCSDLLSLFF